jgi:protein-disulfide isomerase
MLRPILHCVLAVTLLMFAGPAVAAELVYVFEPGCPYCRLWDREIGPVYPKTAEAKRAPLQPIDKSDPALSTLKLAAPVRYTPTFVLMDHGVELGRIEGYPGEDFFWGRLAGLLERLPAQ